MIVDNFLFWFIVKKSCKIYALFPGLSVFVDFGWFLVLGGLIDSDGTPHDDFLDIRLGLRVVFEVFGNSRRIGLNILFFDDMIEVEIIAGSDVGRVVFPVLSIEGVLVGFFGTALPLVLEEGAEFLKKDIIRTELNFFAVLIGENMLIVVFVGLFTDGAGGVFGVGTGENLELR